MKLLIPNDLLYVLLRNNIKNINSFVSRGLFTLMLATCIRHIWVYSILITLSGDIETKPGPKPSSCDKFSICHCNPNSIFVHDLIKYLYYADIFRPIILTFYTYQKVILIQVFLVTA